MGVMVVLITGRSGAGKSTYAKALSKDLRLLGHRVRVLDGDVHRAVNNNSDFSDEGRIRNLTGLARTAQQAELAGFTCIIAALAPRREWRDMMRSMWAESRIVYLPGGTLWSNTTYEIPDDGEYHVRKSA